MTQNNTQIVELELSDDSTLTFNISRENYVKFINESNPNSKFAAMHNFLVRTVCDEDKTRLKELARNELNVSELLGGVLEEYTPDITVVAKKRKTAQSKSSKTATAS